MRSSSRNDQWVLSDQFGEDGEGGKPTVGETRLCPVLCVSIFRHLYHVLHLGVYPTKLDVDLLQRIQATPNYHPFGLKVSFIAL
jgi:hypothetical protein